MTAPPTYPSWLSLKEAAAYTKVAPVTLRREAKAGRLRGCKVGGRRLWRFRVEDVDSWLQQFEVAR